MTTTTNTRDFVRRLRRSELMDVDTLRRSLAAIQTKQGGKLPEDCKAIAEDLIAGGMITQWQARNLLAGRWKGFFLGKYKLLSQLGVGGMSTVYLAEHMVMRRRVALKVLPRNRLDNPKSLARFQQEARTCAMLDHPNVVQVIDFDSADDLHYMVMEYVDGMDLQKLLQREGKLAIDRIIEYLRCCTSGLQHAHERGIIHRDIKPLNILINRDGVLKLSDLGLARLRYDEDPTLSGESKGVLGTADYLAPEQARASHQADGRSDLYSLGCTLFFMLTGRAPFAQGTAAERIAKHQTMPPPSVRELRPDCPPELAEICSRLMAKSPEDRFQTATQLLQAIDRVNWRFHGKSSIAALDMPAPSSASGASLSSADGSGSQVPDVSPLAMSDTTFEDFGNSTSSSDGSDASIDDLLSGFDFSQMPAVSAPSFTSNTNSTSTTFPAAPTNFASSPGTFQATTSPTSFAAKSSPKKTSVGESKTIVYAGIGMAAFAVIFSIAMSVIYVMKPQEDSRSLIKRSESGKGGGIVIIGD